MNKQMKMRIKTLAQKVKEKRQQRGWTQADLAKRANCTQSCISKFEAGVNIRLSYFLQISDSLKSEDTKSE